MIVSSWSDDKNGLALETQNTTWPPHCGLPSEGKTGISPFIYQCNLLFVGLLFFPMDNKWKSELLATAKETRWLQSNEYTRINYKWYVVGMKDNGTAVESNTVFDLEVKPLLTSHVRLQFSEF